MAYRVAPYGPEHAAASARIHAEGQPGTFLTGLGGAFLAALYAQMAASSRCYGFVALEDTPAGAEVVGVIVGTDDAGAVFKDVILRRGLRLLPSVAAALVRRPSLWPKVWETLRYPGRAQGRSGECELLYLGARADRRRQGIGQALLNAAAAEAVRRGASALTLTVDASNQVAQQLYVRLGMRPVRCFTLYGRPMVWYETELPSAQAAARYEGSEHAR
ncbi:MAG: GNAT family N-acetyltransferase [Chloroflexota bacterium]